MIFNIRPTDTYLRCKDTIPEKLKDHHLIILHLNDLSFESERYTTRTRDVIKKQAKMLQFDVSIAYLLDDQYLEKFQEYVKQSKNWSEDFMILAWRLYKNKWISTVDKIRLSEISWIENYATR